MNAQMKREDVDEASGTKRVETVEYRSSAGQGQELRKVEVIHQTHTKSNTSGGVLSNAAASVATTLQSAKDALSQN